MNYEEENTLKTCYVLQVITQITIHHPGVNLVITFVSGSY